MTNQPHTLGTNPASQKENKNKKLFSFNLDSSQTKAIEKFFRKYSELFGESETQRHFGLGNRQDITFAWMHMRNMFKNSSNTIRTHTIKTLEAVDDQCGAEVIGVMHLLQKQHDTMVECFSDPVWKEAELKRVAAMIAASENKH